MDGWTHLNTNDITHRELDLYTFKKVRWDGSTWVVACDWVSLEVSLFPLGWDMQASGLPL